MSNNTNQQCGILGAGMMEHRHCVRICTDGFESCIERYFTENAEKG